MPLIASSLISAATLMGVSWADFEKEPAVVAKAPLEPGRTIAGFEVERPVVEWTAYIEPKDDNPFPARPAVRTRFATSLSASELQPPSPWAAEAGDAPKAPAKASPPLPSKAAPVYASPQSVQPVAQQPMGYVPQPVAYAQPTAYYAAPVASYAVVGDSVGYQTQIVVGGRRGPLRGIGRALFGMRQVAAYGDAGSYGYGYATAQPYGYAPTYSYAAQPRVYAYGGGYRAMVCGPNGCY